MLISLFLDVYIYICMIGLGFNLFFVCNFCVTDNKVCFFQVTTFKLFLFL
jgi:hypothetical protein